MEKKYIIVFDKFINGGCENLFSSIAAQMSDILFYLVVLQDEIDLKKIDQLPENVIYIACKSKNRFIRFAFFYRYIKNNLKDIKFIIDFHETIFCELFLFFNHRNKKCWHWFNTNPEMIFKLSKVKAHLYYKLYSFYEKTICICDTQREVLTKIIPSYPNNRIYVSYNFVDIQNIIEQSKEIIKFDSKYILHISRIDFGAKDFKTLLKAYNMLPTQITDKYKLVIAGDGHDFPLLKKMQQESIYKDNIILIGNQTNPYSWIKNSTLLIISSFFEGFPLVMLEALTLKRPIISSDFLCGAREILAKGKYGLIFKIGDAEMLKQHIEKLLSDTTLLQYYSNNAYERANYYYTEGIKRLKLLFYNFQ